MNQAHPVDTVVPPPNNAPSSSPSNYPTPPGIEMSETFPGVVKPIPERTIFEWKSPSRPFKKRRRQYYTTLGTIVLLLSLILFFAGQVLPVAVVLSVAFLAYIMSTIPPHDIKQKITTYGIRQDDQVFYWQELGRFWFEDKLDQTMMLVEVYRFPNRLSLMLGQASKKDLTAIMSEILLLEKPELTTYDKAAKWLQEKVPLDIDGDEPSPKKQSK